MLSSQKLVEIGQYQRENHDLFSFVQLNEGPIRLNYVEIMQ